MNMNKAVTSALNISQCFSEFGLGHTHLLMILIVLLSGSGF